MPMRDLWYVILQWLPLMVKQLAFIESHEYETIVNSIPKVGPSR